MTVMPATNRNVRRDVIMSPPHLGLPSRRDRGPTRWCHGGAAVVTASRVETNAAQAQVGILGPLELTGTPAGRTCAKCGTSPRRRVASYSIRSSTELASRST